MSFLAAVLTGLAGFLAFNVVDGVFGLVESILGLVVCIAVTVFVVRRSPPPEEGDESVAASLGPSSSAMTFGVLSAWVMLIGGPFPARSNQQTGGFEMSTRDPKQPNQKTDDARNSSTADDSASTNTRKDPDEWVTGNESMTGAQASYLKTLSEEAGEPFDEELTKAEASKKIDELQSETGRGIDH
jgi:hypothetical protein